MIRRAFLLATTLLAACSQAQSLAEYMKLRKANGITQPVSVSALDSMVGTKVVEIAGRVKGSFRVGDRGSIMVERAPGGGVTVVDCENLPSWLVGNEVRARLIVSATREAEGMELNATLLAAAPESDVAAKDQKAAPPKAAVKKMLASRGSTRTTPRRNWTMPVSEVTPIYASFIKKVNPRLSNAEALEIATGIIGFSLHYGVDARLIMAMVMVESGFNPNATSRSGAQGLGQLMPGTAAGLGVNNSYDSIENLYGTVKLVRGHLDTYKKQTGEDFDALVLALAAYNAGSGAVRRHGGVPPYAETQNYVRKVILTYQKLAGG